MTIAALFIGILIGFLWRYALSGSNQLKYEQPRRNWNTAQIIGDDLDVITQHGNQIIFHGGCHGCSMQLKHGIEFCAGCQYFEADWSLPDLNDEHARREAKMEEIRQIAKIKNLLK